MGLRRSVCSPHAAVNSFSCLFELAGILDWNQLLTECAVGSLMIATSVSDDKQQ